MSLHDFFRVVMPYGMKKNQDGSWFLFNREYLPIGWNDESYKESISQNIPYHSIPVHTFYKDLSEEALTKIAIDEKHIVRNEKEEIESLYFYIGETDPLVFPEYFSIYFSVLQKLSRYVVVPRKPFNN